MSDQEKNSGVAADSSVVLVEQAAMGRHKQAFHPIDVQDDAHKELHHKRSKAPAVPSVTEELKDSTDAANKDRKEAERAMSSEKQKHNIPKKLSSSTKRRGSFPEVIPMAPMGPVAVGVKKSPTVPSQPILEQVTVTEVISGVSIGKKDTEKKDDEDSTTEKIAEVRTPEAAKASEWVCAVKHPTHVLNPETSIVSCYRSEAPIRRPSGITIQLQNSTKKFSIKSETEKFDPKKSVINITLSNKCLLNKTIYRNHEPQGYDPTNDAIRAIQKGKLCGALQRRIAIMSERIRKTFF